MRQVTRTLLAAGALALSMSAGAPSAAVAAESPSTALARAATAAYPGEAFSQYRRGYYGRGYYGRGYRRGYGGGAVAAGVVGGLALGALAAGAIANSQPAYGYGGPGTPVGNVYGRDPGAVDYCARRYRSYDPRTGTFLANDGLRYPCP